MAARMADLAVAQLLDLLTDSCMLGLFSPAWQQGLCNGHFCVARQESCVVVRSFPGLQSA